MSDDDLPPWRTEPRKMEIQFPSTPKKVEWHKNWFSNMLPFDEDKPLEYEGIVYKSVENFYQAVKLPRDRQDLRLEISKLTPQKSKTAIRDIKKYQWDENWNAAKSLKVMEFALRHKFQPGTSWHKLLMETGDEEIIEWNNWNDIFWGKCLETKQGENHLGILLMKLRKEYKNTKVVKKAKDVVGIYIGRGSLFGNPYSHIRDKETKAEFIVESREESLDKYREYFYKKVKEDRDFRKAVCKLRNETLVCYCKPLACHGDIIIEWLFKNINS